MSRTTDFGGVRSRAPTAGSRQTPGRPVWSSSSSGLGWVISSSALHALVVLEAVALHLADRLAARLVLLLRQDLAWVVERRLDHADHVERVVSAACGAWGVIRIEQVDRREGERRSSGWLRAKFGCRSTTSRMTGPATSTISASRSVRNRARARLASAYCSVRGWWLSNTSERTPACEHVAAAADHVDQHRRGDLHLRAQRLGLGVDDLGEGVLAPRDEALRRLLAGDLLALLDVIARLAQRLGVLDLVLGTERDDVAVRVVAGGARPARRSDGTRARRACASAARRTCSAP